MEIALIPPSSLMHYAESFRYQMMLPSPQNINYLQYYRRMGSDTATTSSWTMASGKSNH